MFSIEYHNNLEGFQKLGYVADVLRFPRLDIVRIIGEDATMILGALIKGDISHVHQDIREKINEKCYRLRMLFSSVLKLAGYDENKAQDILEDVHDFHQCIVQPPWYLAQKTLRTFITDDGMDAVQSSMEWLHNY